MIYSHKGGAAKSADPTENGKGSIMETLYIDIPVVVLGIWMTLLGIVVYKNRKSISELKERLEETAQDSAALDGD